MENKYIKTLKVKDYPPINVSVYSTEEAYNQIASGTSYLPLSKIPEPDKRLRTVGDYVKAYEAIHNGDLSYTVRQRILIKNVVHSELRVGNLKPLKNETN